MACTVLLSGLALAQVGNVVRLTGTAGTGATPAGYFQASASFACAFEAGPSGPCTGTYNATVRPAYCSNTFQISNTFFITGMDLSRAGAIQGTSVMTTANFDGMLHPDGTCTINPGTAVTLTNTFTGTWDGTRSNFAYPPDVDERGNVFQWTGSFAAERAAGSAPVFPMVVSSRIDSSTATASAAIQYRPQDVGTSGSVYVFAVAPSNLVKSAADGSAPFTLGKSASTDADKADSVACVLAQLNSSGQLQAVSSSNLQAYVTGVLTAQGQAVTILNGVPTASVGGSTFYVGYGASSSAMITNGINRSALTVPGTRVCKPQAPQTGWWWNPREGGRGYSVEVAGNNIFFAAFLYDIAGRSTWHVATGPTSLDGSVFNGQLLSFGNGVTLGGAYRTNTRLPDAGPISLTFDDASHGTLVWPDTAIAIERFPIVNGGLATPLLANLPENGWWWGGSADDGRGFFIEWQNSPTGPQADLVGYMYDDSGRPVWYLAVYPTPDARTFSGHWWSYANGQSLNGAYKPATLVDDRVAPVTIQFQGADTALLTLPTGILPISRFRF